MFLGLNVDECLHWKKHCDRVSSSLNSVRFLIRGLKNILYEEQRLMLYNAKTESCLRYGLFFGIMTLPYSYIVSNLCVYTFKSSQIQSKQSNSLQDRIETFIHPFLSVTRFLIIFQ